MVKVKFTLEPMKA